MSVAWATTSTPVGDVLLQTDGHQLTGISFAPFRPPSGPADPSAPILAQAVEQLAEYFAGRRRAFDLPLADSGTPFQRRVWEALRTIPYGTTTTYGAIARNLGLPAGASRAVGIANGANPLPVVVPCHRVIGSNGLLTGYSGGLWRKQQLLDLEIPGLF